MVAARQPFQGVFNILRFNWHFFLGAVATAAAVAAAGYWLGAFGRSVAVGVVFLLAGTTLLSLLVSFYVYDLSGLYRLDWLEQTGVEGGPGTSLANIHAGFDETTELLRDRYPAADWTVMDFYDPSRHTEISIRRARLAHPPSPDDLSVETTDLPLSDHTLNAAFVILAAHEIRDRDERCRFFGELRRALEPGGRLVVVEHLRDWRNFLAYSLGAFHFLSRRSWLESFERAGLRVAHTFAPNFFMTCFVLEKSADAS